EFGKMNFEFDINPLLPHEVTKFNSSLRIVHPDHLATDDPMLRTKGRLCLGLSLTDRIE
ncbi:hypothetical protein BpHYR1_007021, partial [Brachionus plicatilis]